MPPLVLKNSDAIRFTLGGQPVDPKAAAAAKVRDIDVKAGTRPGQFELVVTLVIAGSAVRRMDAWKYESESAMWAGLAEFAAGRQADLALEAHDRDDSGTMDGRTRR